MAEETKKTTVKKASTAKAAPKKEAAPKEEKVEAKVEAPKAAKKSAKKGNGNKVSAIQPRLKVKYETEVKKALLEKYNYSSVMQIQPSARSSLTSVLVMPHKMPRDLKKLSLN